MRKCQAVACLQSLRIHPSRTSFSDTVIITKNLPAGVEVEELQRMFGKFGDVEKVLMPPG